MALPNYGLDADLKAKQDAKYSPALEAEVTAWIQAVSGEQKGGQSFAEWLKNGQVLCKLVNAIKPGTVKKINTQAMPFKQMENITFFMNAAREFGVPESAMFGTPDLYEEKNIGTVVGCLFTLGGAVQKSVPNFSGPKLGVAMVENRDKKRGSQLLTDQSAGLSTKMEVARPTERADYVVKPVQGNNAATTGASGGYSKNTTGHAPLARSSFGGGGGATTGASGGGGATTGARSSFRAGAAPAAPSSAPRTSAAAAPKDDCTYGLDADLKAKQSAKYDVGLEQEVTAWIEGLTKKPKGSADFAEWLKNGHVLCDLVNAIKPGIVKKINTQSMPFKQMENITFFMNAAREMGVPESAMFGTPDLYEEKNLGSVVNTIYTLGGAIQVTQPSFKGPKLGVPIHVESRDKKRNSQLLTDQSAGLSTKMEVARPTERADYVVKPINR